MCIRHILFFYLEHFFITDEVLILGTSLSWRCAIDPWVRFQSGSNEVPMENAGIQGANKGMIGVILTSPMLFVRDGALPLCQAHR